MIQKIPLRRIIPLLLISQWALGAVDVPDLPVKLTVSKALYINCLQRTQTQQLLKAYLQIGLKMAHGSFKKDFGVSVERYDQRLRKLNEFFLPKLDEAHRNDLIQAQEIWAQSKEILLQDPTRENALKLDENFHKMIALLGKAKVLAQKSFRAVGLTGGMCRDPLFVTNIYLMKLYGVDVPDYKNKMKKRLDHFSKNMQELAAYPSNTDAIKQHLKAAQKNFTFFLYMYDSDNTYVPTLIARKADKIFVSIRTIKQLYGEMTAVNR